MPWRSKGQVSHFLPGTLPKVPIASCASGRPSLHAMLLAGIEAGTCRSMWVEAVCLRFAHRALGAQVELVTLLVRAEEVPPRAVADICRLLVDDAHSVRHAAAGLVADMLEEQGQRRLTQVGHLSSPACRPVISRMPQG
jgi:hypothetical protein